MRTKVKPGSHRVALFDGDRKVYEATVDVKDGGTATLVKDLPVEMAVEMAPPRETPPPPPPAPAPRAEASRGPSLRACRRPRSGRGPRRGTAARLVARRIPASLQITSPGLYGVVWINGRPRGYPPLEVGRCRRRTGEDRVRVNGIEKRTKTVVVAPGRSLNVDLR